MVSAPVAHDAWYDAMVLEPLALRGEIGRANVLVMVAYHERHLRVAQSGRGCGVLEVLRQQAAPQHEPLRARGAA